MTRKIFITGGARRLGRAMAVHLSNLGHEVTVHYHASESEAHALQAQTTCRLFRADFAAVPVAELGKRLAEEVGPVDVLVNNASSFRRSPWKEIDEDLWDHEFAVNLKVPFFLMQHFGGQMKAAGKGRILNLVDIAAERAYLPYLPYSIAKAGMAAATRAMARVLAPEVQVNGIAPGTILFTEETGEEARRRIIDRIPAGRTATVTEFLRTVDFLISDVEYITGHILTLDGGRSLVW